MACFADVLFQVLTSKKVYHIFSKSKLLIKTLFQSGTLMYGYKSTGVVLRRLSYYFFRGLLT